MSRVNWAYPDSDYLEYLLAINCIIAPTQLVAGSTSIFKGLSSSRAISENSVEDEAQLTRECVFIDNKSHLRG